MSAPQGNQPPADGGKRQIPSPHPANPGGVQQTVMLPQGQAVMGPQGQMQYMVQPAGMQYAAQPGMQMQMQPMHGQMQMQMAPGQMQMAPGQMQMAPGQMQMAPGQMQMAPGQMQMAPGQMQMAPGQMQMMPAQMQMMQGQMQMMQPLWMMKPPTIPNCPPGLEYLTQLDQLLVKQQIELMEVFTNFEMKNRYIIRNVMGQQVYFAHEESDCCARQCCGARRPFTLHIEDNMGQEVIQIERPYKCICMGQCCSCSECCQDEVEVQSPPGETVGYVKQLYEGCEVMYAIQNAEKNIILRIKGPSYFHCYCPGDDVPFSLTSSDGQHEVGRISKQWSNLIREYFTSADNFGIQFPMDLDVRVKAVVLGAVFLIDFMFFEQQQRRQY